MKFYEFGNKDKNAIFLLPGTCCHWKNNFGHVIDLLTENFYVVCVSYDGFDEMEQKVFPNMITEVEKIETYVQTHFNGRICAAYGCSLGGSFVGLLIQREKIHIDHGFLGSSDLDQEKKLKAKFTAAIVTPILYNSFKKCKVHKWLTNRWKKNLGEEYVNAFLKFMFGQDGQKMDFLKKESIHNQFYWDLVTEIRNNIDVSHTTVHCLFAKKMGDQYVQRYKQHFKNPNIIIHDLQHEELLLLYPEEWATVIKNSVNNPIDDVRL